MVGAVRGDLNDLSTQALDQRGLFSHRVNHHNAVIGGEENIDKLTFCRKGLAGACGAKIQTVGVFVKRNFLGAGKSYTIKGKQAEKKAKNALCGRLKCVLMAGNIKPLPTSGKRLRQG